MIRKCFLMLMHQRGPGSYRKGWSMNIKKTSPGNQGKITSHGMVNGHKNKPWKPGKDNFSWEDKKRSTGNQGNSYNLSWVASHNISVQWICFLMFIDKWVLNII